MFGFLKKQFDMYKQNKHIPILILTQNVKKNCIDRIFVGKLALWRMQKASLPTKMVVMSLHELLDRMINTMSTEYSSTDSNRSSQICSPVLYCLDWLQASDKTRMRTTHVCICKGPPPVLSRSLVGTSLLF